MCQVKPLGWFGWKLIWSCWKTETFALTKLFFIFIGRVLLSWFFLQKINIQITQVVLFSEFLVFQKYSYKSDCYRLFCFWQILFSLRCVLVLMILWFSLKSFFHRKLEYSRHNAKIKYEWVCNSTYSSDLLSYTNGSHDGFVEFCVIEVFKF